MQTEFETTKGRFLAVGIETGTTEHKVFGMGLFFYSNGYLNRINVPTGSEIIGLYSQLTEEQAAGIVEDGMHYDVQSASDSRCIRDYYYNYMKNERPEFYTAIESLNTLLTANRVDTSKEVLILKVKTNDQ